VLAERKEPDWTQIDSGITILDLTMDLHLDPAPVSQPPFVHDVRRGTVQTTSSCYEPTLAVWGGAVTLTSGARFYTLSALTP